MLIARRFFPFAALAISLLIVGIVVGIMPDGTAGTGILSGLEPASIGIAVTGRA